MRFRTALFIGILVLIGAVLAATVTAVSVVVNRSARAQVEDDLLHARQVFLELHGFQQEKNRYQARVIANEPRLRAVVDSEEADRATVLDVARTLHRDAGTDLFLVTDGDGFLLADVLHPEDEGADLSQMPVVARALEHGEASALWTPPGTIYRVAARRMDFGRRTTGVLVIGHSLSDEGAADAAKQVGSPVAVMLDDALVAVAGLGDAGRDAIASAVGEIDPTSVTPVEVSVAGTTYLAQGGRFEDYAGDRSLRYVVLRDLDEALAPGERVTRILFLVAAASVLAAIVFAVILSRRLSRPMDELVAFTREVARGRLERRARGGGLVEVNTLSDAMNRMVSELDDSRKQMKEKERLENELEIAQQIQTSILPRETRLEGLEIAARMVPAEEVGGDYYDILPGADGGWIAIGDVSGHGLTAGLVMMMIQTGVASLVEAEAEADEDASPAEVLCRLNRVIYDNVHVRLEAERHATATLFRFRRDGVLTWAGAHMDVVLLRRGAEQCETVVTQGTWLGITEEIDAVTGDAQLKLEDGDLVVLYTDGLTEAMDEVGSQLGIEPVLRVVESRRDEPVVAIRDAVFDCMESFAASQEDDVTVLVMRYRSD